MNTNSTDAEKDKEKEKQKDKDKDKTVKELQKEIAEMVSNIENKGYLEYIATFILITSNKWI